VRTHVSLIESLDTTTYFIGKGIILFTMFYCTLNWAHYKRLREDVERREKENKDNKDTKK
jgi:hypothetical protein